MTNSADKRLYLIDAYAMIFRGYYALIRNPRHTSKGLDTSAIFGFTNSLIELIRREKPSHLAVVFDVGRASVRTDDFADYKANRSETPEAIKIAVPYIHRILEAMHIPILGVEGYEADDVIGTIACKAENEGYTTFMVTPDKDFAQLVTDKIKIYKPASKFGDVEILGVEEVKAKYEIEDPKQVIDFLAMMGDAVDNIPGLEGVGEKTALKFLKEYGSIENLLANTAQLKGKLKEKIENSAERGILSKKLATIICDVPIEFHQEQYDLETPDFEKVREVFDEIEFRRLYENLYRAFHKSEDGSPKSEETSKPESSEAYLDQREKIHNPKPETRTSQHGTQLDLFANFEELEQATSTKKTVKDNDHLYQFIDTPKAQKILVKNLMAQKVVCFDTETTSLNEMEAELVGMSFSYKKGLAYYIPLSEKREEVLETLEIFKPFFEKEDVLKGFKNFMNNPRTQMKGKYATYILKNNPKLNQLADLLKINKIEYSYATEKSSASGFNYFTKKDENFSVEPNDLIVKVDQPKAVFTQILFEPTNKMTDSLSYDITAWNLPLAYGVQGYAVKNALNLKTKNSIETVSKSIPKAVYAFYVPWNNRTSAEILAQLHQKEIKVRYAMKQAVFGDVTIEPGGLMIARGDNPKIADFENTVAEIVKKKSDFATISSGFSKNAKDLGGENFPLMKAPKVLLLSGNGVTSTEFGAAWYYFDEILNYPVTIVDQDKLRNVKLFEFNTLVLADGRYIFSDADMKRLNEWINNGGKVIAIDGALNVFDGKDGYTLNPYATDEEKQAAEKAKKEKELKERFLDSGNEERRMLANSIPGAIIENNLDVTHPLSFGLGKKYYSLKTGDKIYSLLKGANNVAYVPKNYKSYGYIGHDFGKKLPETVSFAVESKGAGKVVYMIDNPLFRAFWENGILLFSNALFLVN